MATTAISRYIQKHHKMGKPTWVEGGGRRGAIGSNSNLLNSPDQPAEPHFPRRYPRTGTAFQCKGIPDIQEHYVSTRASDPEPMSVDVPYRTVTEMKAFEKDGSSSCVDDDSFNVPVSNNNGSNIMSLRSKGKANEHLQSNFRASLIDWCNCWVVFSMEKVCLPSHHTMYPTRTQRPNTVLLPWLYDPRRQLKRLRFAAPLYLYGSTVPFLSFFIYSLYHFWFLLDPILKTPIAVCCSLSWGSRL